MNRRRFINLGVGLVPLGNQCLLNEFLDLKQMKMDKDFDVVIIGGSYAGLAAAMAFGRALKKVLVIDSGQPCNKQTPQSHNFLTNDGRPPAEIAAIARAQVSAYHTVHFFSGRAVSSERNGGGFCVMVESGERFNGKKIFFATGINDLLPQVQGLAECWGISVIHCPYCHGYEFKGGRTGVLAKGEAAFDFARLIWNWAEELTVFTDGGHGMSEEQLAVLSTRNISVVEKKIHGLEHQGGYIDYILFEDGSRRFLRALYAPRPFEQHCHLPERMGCELTAEGHIKVDSSFQTSVTNVYAIGDCASKMRTVANAVAMGTSAGLMVSKQMILEKF